MKLIVGLGNPGDKYEKNRHNIGFLFVDELQHKRGASAWQRQKNINSIVSELTYGDEQMLLIKPQTFMNLSGAPVGALTRYFRMNSSDVIVVQDDLDLSFGTVKLRENGGHGGHNGIRDIIQKLGTENFWRIKIGVGRPATREEVHNYVLSNFSKQEQLGFSSIFEQSEKIIEELLKNLQKNIKKI